MYKEFYTECAVGCIPWILLTRSHWHHRVRLGGINAMRPRQDGCYVPDIFKCVLLNENVQILISLKFVPEGLINNIPALDLIMAWHQPGGKPLSEAIMVRLLMHICITRSQWVKCIYYIVHEYTGIHLILLWLLVISSFVSEISLLRLTSSMFYFQLKCRHRNRQVSPVSPRQVLDLW